MRYNYNRSLNILCSKAKIQGLRPAEALAKAGFLFLLLFFVPLIICNAKKNESVGNRLQAIGVKLNNNFYISVLLVEKKLSDKSSWVLTSEKGFFLSDNDDANSRTFFVPCKSLRIHVKHKNIYINGTKYLRKQIKIMPKGDDISFANNLSQADPCSRQGYQYQGYFIVAVDKKDLLLINRLELEDYIYAVLRSETWPGWPLEVNKVFAVAIRSYAISKVLEANKCRRLYHIKNDNRHQTYKGYKFHVRNSSVLRKAVEKTRGMFLGYEGKPIIAMFDSCCGGVVPALVDGFIDFKKAPYLKRDCSCKYCRKCSLYSWNVSYTVDEFLRILSDVCPRIKDIRSLWVSKKDKAGVVKGVTVRGKRLSWSIVGDKLYSLLKDVKSFCFDIKKSGDTICLHGKGYGHHIGLCQWGARQLVRELKDYKEILKFYYPGTEFMWLS